MRSFYSFLLPKFHCKIVITTLRYLTTCFRVTCTSSRKHLCLSLSNLLAIFCTTFIYAQVHLGVRRGLLASHNIFPAHPGQGMLHACVFYDTCPITFKLPETSFCTVSTADVPSLLVHSSQGDHVTA